MEMHTARFTGAVHTLTVRDSFFGLGEQEWCDDDWFVDEGYHSVADLCTVYGDWQETDEDQTTWYDATGKRIPGMGSRIFVRNSHTMSRPLILDGQLKERDDDATAVQLLQQAVLAANALEDATPQA